MRMKKIQEGLGELADAAERDHEVQMARSDLYKLAKYAIKLHDMLKSVSEAEGIEGWQQAKITKAADYISSVYHALDYDMKFSNKGDMTNAITVETIDYIDSLNIRLSEKAVSQSQQQAAGIALAAKRGGKKPEAGTASSEMMSMSIAELEKIAGTKHKGLPDHVDEGLCPDCGNPSWRTLSEEKQKGVDGKVCWKGYKRMGTKQKGGKTVDNCVKEEEKLIAQGEREIAAADAVNNALNKSRCCQTNDIY